MKFWMVFRNRPLRPWGIGGKGTLKVTVIDEPRSFFFPRA